jgi:anti-sigma factor RsiW
VTGMTCAECVEFASAHVDGALDRATTRNVLDHLAGCDGCTAYVGQIRRTVALLASLREPGRYA